MEVPNPPERMFSDEIDLAKRIRSARLLHGEALAHDRQIQKLHAQMILELVRLLVKPEAVLAKHLGDPGRIDRYLPWSEDVPAECRLSPGKAAEAAEMPDEPIVDAAVLEALSESSERLTD